MLEDHAEAGARIEQKRDHAAEQEDLPRHTPRAPPKTAMNGNNQIMYWGDSTLPKTMKASTAAAENRRSSAIPDCRKAHMTTRSAVAWTGNVRALKK